VFTAAIDESATPVALTKSDNRQMTKICRNNMSEDVSITAPLRARKRHSLVET
jgi:hypothetical protein